MKKISVSKGGEREKKYSQTTRLIFLHTHTLLRGDQISVRIHFFQNRKRNCCGEKTAGLTLRSRECDSEEDVCGGRRGQTLRVRGRAGDGREMNAAGRRRKQKERRKKNPESQGSDFLGGKWGHCVAAFLRLIGIRGRIPSGALAFLTRSSLFKHFQLPPQTPIHRLSNR